MIEIDHDPELSPCGIRLFREPRETCPHCPCALTVVIVSDGRSSPAARERAQERGTARAADAPRWGQIHV